MASESVVYVVDDDEAICDSLLAVLESAGYEARAFQSAAEFLKNCDPARPACLLVDVRMPDMDGLELQRRVAAQHPQFAVIVMTGHGDVPLAVQAMKGGALDFIEKPFEHTALLDAVSQALKQSMTLADANLESVEAQSRLSHLSQREREVLEGLVDGLANKVIAHKLEISPRTVEIYRARLMDKMKARSLPELIRLAISAGVKASH